MADKVRTYRAEWERLRRSAMLISTGGDWAFNLPRWSQRNLSFFWLDGFFSAGHDNIVLTYLVLYILALGASRSQIGLLSSLTNLTGALLLLPGAMLVERLSHRKHIILGASGIARFSLVILAALPLLLSGQTLVYVAIALSVTKDAFNNLAYPAWMALTGDIVPLAGRGRYFASRNFIIGAAGMVTTLLIGQVITHSGQPVGYQIALVIAFGLGISSTYSFSRIRDPHETTAPKVPAPLAMPALLRSQTAQPGFLVLIGTSALWNFSVNVPGPFFTVYLVQNLGASAIMVGVTSIASSLAALLVQRRLGTLADRWGARRMQLVSGLVIPILPDIATFLFSA